ncbi:hypothetical protein [Streptomyces sp. NBC_00842]|uniref:hypothetical protein n=1 Tax=Streptomyces sp. NBC_00842 TaxID=2975848 RepID=UPI003869B23F|nr:hypothetical protein OH821_32800 [Streptomyces sp. NBC_00842]
MRSPVPPPRDPDDADSPAGKKRAAVQDRVKKWRSGGGGEMRAEFEASIAGK